MELFFTGVVGAVACFFLIGMLFGAGALALAFIAAFCAILLIFGAGELLDAHEEAEAHE